MEHKAVPSVQYQIAQAILIQMGRVGTILFFIISGFFLNDKMANYTPVRYLQYRFKSLIVPWLIFVLLIAFLQLCTQFSISQLTSGHALHLAFVFWIFS